MNRGWDIDEFHLGTNRIRKGVEFCLRAKLSASRHFMT